MQERAATCVFGRWGHVQDERRDVRHVFEVDILDEGKSLKTSQQHSRPFRQSSKVTTVLPKLWLDDLIRAEYGPLRKENAENLWPTDPNLR